MESLLKSLEVPSDVKFVNTLTTVLFGAFILLLAANVFQYLIKNSTKTLDAILFTGNTNHANAQYIKNNVLADLSGNFYSMNLANTKKVFESMAWVKNASIKRVYPNTIEVKLSEYKPVAVWGARENIKLVDEAGTIFEASADEDEYESMPQLIGAEDQTKLMLDMYTQISTALVPLKSSLKILELTTRGSWVATLDGGVHIELGRGTSIEVVNRVAKFAMTTEKMLSRLNKKSIDFQYVDLRHTDGYAMRMHGVSTLDLTVSTTAIKK